MHVYEVMYVELVARCCMLSRLSVVWGAYIVVH